MTINPLPTCVRPRPSQPSQTPANRGAYKLRETQQNLNRMIATLDAVGDYLRRRPQHRGPMGLGGCTTDDKAIYLKRIPTTLAKMFGYDVLPAIATLTGDGVPQHNVRQALGQIQRRVEYLLDECDVQHASLKKGIKAEYENMKAGYSELYGLLTDALDLVRDAQAVQEFHERREKYRPQSGHAKGLDGLFV